VVLFAGSAGAADAAARMLFLVFLDMLLFSCDDSLF